MHHTVVLHGYQEMSMWDDSSTSTRGNKIDCIIGVHLHGLSVCHPSQQIYREFLRENRAQTKSTVVLKLEKSQKW